MNRLREIRKARNLTMKELGKLVGVSESAIGNYELGKRDINYEMLLKLSEELGCSVSDIYGENNIPAAELIGSGLTENQRYLLSIIPDMTDYDVAVLASTAKALLGNHKSQDDS